MIFVIKIQNKCGAENINFFLFFVFIFLFTGYKLPLSLKLAPDEGNQQITKVFFY